MCHLLIISFSRPKRFPFPKKMTTCKYIPPPATISSDFLILCSCCFKYILHPSHSNDSYVLNTYPHLQLIKHLDLRQYNTCGTRWNWWSPKSKYYKGKRIWNGYPRPAWWCVISKGLEVSRGETENGRQTWLKVWIKNEWKSGWLGLPEKILDCKKLEFV